MSTPTLLIQCLLRRAGGSLVECDGKKYHFKPDNPADIDAIHTCEVPVEDVVAIHHFRRTAEAYKILGDQAAIPPAPKEPAGQTMAAHKAAVEQTPATAHEAEAKPAMLTGPDGAEHNLSAMSREQLAQFAKDNFGIKVTGRWNTENLIDKILDAARGE